MELWIRSQSRRRLSKIKDLYIVDADYEERVIICGYSSDESDDFDLGSYNTIERALEILDEIHQRLIDLQALNHLSSETDISWLHGRNVDCVYLMPKE